MNQSLSCAFLLIGLCGGIASGANEKAIEETRARIEEWAQTRRVMAEEKTHWEFEKQMLENTREMLNKELALLEEKLVELQEESDQSKGEREKLNQEKDDYVATAEAVKTLIMALEMQAQALISYFPEPLKQTLEPLIRRIPQDPQATTVSLGSRLQTIVGILSQADKFNGTFTLVSETRPSPTGQEFLVKTLYLGLAQAYSVDASGDFAAIGHPSAEGWIFDEQSGLGDEMLLLMDIYEGGGEIQFVSLPAKIN